MLKVVGASWLQTRISTYILIAVALLGIVAIIIGELGHVENDGTYSATVWWKHRGGYRIDFWGQGNDLTVLPMGVARAYYQTGISETGWSTIEIETSAEYPDDIQAYSAGLLEGSLTWQLIHHHWHNTVRAACAPKAALCRKMRRYLRENAQHSRENANLLKAQDPYWHMVHLFYAQLDGLEAGWRFAVRRSRQSVDIPKEDFLWLAMASDLPDLERASNGSESHSASDGMIFLKALPREHFEPLIALAHNTAGPYARMLRLVKRYKFSYHVSPDVKSNRVPSKSIVMTSYPGALSSQDESYMIAGEDRELIVAGTPITINNRGLWRRLGNKDQVMSPARIMAANRLSTDGKSWSHLVARQNSGTSNRQWVTIEPRTSKVWLVEQIPGTTHAAEHTKEFFKNGFLSCSGSPIFESIKKILGENRDDSVVRVEIVAKLQQNIASLEDVRNLMRGYGQEQMAKFSSNSSSTTNYDSELRANSSTEAELDLDLRVNSDSKEERFNMEEDSITRSDMNSKSNSDGDAKSGLASSFENVLKENSDVPSDSNLDPEVGSSPDSQEILDSGNIGAEISVHLAQILAYRGDLEKNPRPIGVIDTKIFLFDLDGLETFEATSGPAIRSNGSSFNWSATFPNSSHIGQPEVFNFESVSPRWIWN